MDMNGSRRRRTDSRHILQVSIRGRTGQGTGLKTRRQTINRKIDSRRLSSKCHRRLNIRLREQRRLLDINLKRPLKQVDNKNQLNQQLHKHLSPRLGRLISIGLHLVELNRLVDHQKWSIHCQDSLDITQMLLQTRRLGRRQVDQ